MAYGLLKYQKDKGIFSLHSTLKAQFYTGPKLTINLKLIPCQNTCKVDHYEGLEGWYTGINIYKLCV